MADAKEYISRPDELGNIHISEEVLAVIAAAATLESVAELNACRDAFPFTETEAVCLTVARDRKAGRYHLMSAQNPIYLFTFQQKEPCS